MAETENTRLAERLASIATALAKPNGHDGHVATDLSAEVITALAKSVAPFVRETVAQALAPLEQRNVALEGRLIALEQAPTMKYCGPWEPERTYFVGDFVTSHGSLWHCEKACAGVHPGAPGGVWTLAVKHGRDLRDKR